MALNSGIAVCNTEPVNTRQEPDGAVVLPVYASNIPQLLKDIPQWILWRAGALKANGKYDKVPTHPRGYKINAHDTKNWLSFEQAITHYKSGEFSGIGFDLNCEPIANDDTGALFLIGVDIDRVTSDASDNPCDSPAVQEVWQALGRPYLETSPSGKGVRMFVLSREPVKAGNENNREMYTSGRFLTLTGRGEGEIVEATDAVLKLRAEWFPDEKPKRAVHRSDVVTDSNPETPENIERVKSALATISADCDYDKWRNMLWSIAATGWRCAEQIARDWSESAPQRYDDDGFNSAWDGYDTNHNNAVGVGTLFHFAHLEGWRGSPNVLQNPLAAASADSSRDILNGRLFAAANRGKLLFIHETADVLQFTHAGWVKAPPGEADRAAKQIVAKMRDDAAKFWKENPDDPKAKRLLSHVDSSSTESKLCDMIGVAKSEPGMTVSLTEFDANQFMLGVKNGVLDLQAGCLLNTSPELLVSKRANAAFDAGAECPVWCNFLDVVQPDRGVQRLLQQLAGLMLSGDAGLQKLVFLFGLGANGKTTFIEAIAWLLGDYCQRVQTELLMHQQRNSQGPSADIVALKGVRLVYCNEVEEGRRLAESRVKEMTGGDTLTGRAPYAKSEITFQPTHKLVMVGNHRPEIHDMSHGMWRRMLIIPFDVTVSDAQRDPQLSVKLKAESAGILNWALSGLQDYLANGLQIPSVIEGATQDYKEEQDLIGDCIDACFQMGAGLTVAKQDAYKAYIRWAKGQGLHPTTQSRFTRRLNERGYKLDAGKRNIQKLELNAEMKLWVSVPFV